MATRQQWRDWWNAPGSVATRVHVFLSVVGASFAAFMPAAHDDRWYAFAIYAVLIFSMSETIYRIGYEQGREDSRAESRRAERASKIQP